MYSHEPGGLFLRRKWTFRSGGRQLVVEKNRLESREHVLMKAFLWALYLPEYPDLQVEIRIGDRFKPDLIARDESGRSIFWGESGKVKPSKIESILRRHREAHLAVAKWDANPKPYAREIEKILRGLRGTRRVDLLVFPGDSAERFIGTDGELKINEGEYEVIRF